ncbi:Four and a half LIM domain protein 1 [Taenia solium]|eukprot:TsM_000361000 transcript=TsM_000361000 gene=TsM_000361000
MPSRRDQVRKSDSRKSGKSEQDQSDQEELPQKSQKGSGKQKNQQQQRGSDRGRADGQEDDPCGRQQQQQQQQGTGQKQQGQRPHQQEETVNELNNCVKCGEETTAGQVITLSGRKWHPECFTCGGCCMVLARVSFFLDGERIYCPSCWARNVKSNCSVSSSALPRCDGEITPEAMVVNFGIRRFHKACFICSRCRCDLAGLQFCIKGNHFTCQQCM